MSNKVLIGLIMTALLAGLIPFMLVARSRASMSEKLPIHLVMDMDKQSKYKAQRESAMYADARAMRPQVEGTVAREDLVLKNEMLNDPIDPRPINGIESQIVISDPTLFAAVMLGRVRPAGMTDEQFDALKPPVKDDEVAADAKFYVRTIPTPMRVTADFMKRGQERFNIYCSPCHGISGYGDGPVAQRAKGLQDSGVDSAAAAGWVAPQDLTVAKIISRPDGHLFNTITHGIRNMPAYDRQIEIQDRWAIIAYVRALERSQNAKFEDLTPLEQGRLK